MLRNRTLCLWSLLLVPSVASTGMADKVEGPPDAQSFVYRFFIQTPADQNPHFLSPEQVQRIDSIRVGRSYRKSDGQRASETSSYQLNPKDQSATRSWGLQSEGRLRAECKFTPDRRAYRELIAFASASLVSSIYGRFLEDAENTYEINFNERTIDEKGEHRDREYSFYRADASVESDILRFLKSDLQARCPEPEAGPVLRSIDDFSEVTDGRFSYPDSIVSTDFFIDHSKKELYWNRQEIGREVGIQISPCDSDRTADYKLARKAFANARIERPRHRAPAAKAFEPHLFLLQRKDRADEFAINDKGQPGRNVISGLGKLIERARDFQSQCKLPKGWPESSP